MATTAEIITQLYVGYYDRAPDPAGLNYWVGRYTDGMTLGQIAQSFAVQTESTTKYPYLANPNIASSTTFITTIYQNLFGRAPDAEGLAYWQGQLASGGVARVGNMIIDIISGAQGDDKTIVENKVQVGVYWAQKTAEVPGFNYSATAAASAEGVLDTVTKDAASVTTSKAAVDTYVANAGPQGSTLTLSTNVDNPVATAFGDKFLGVIDTTGTTSTLTAADILDGGAGTDQLSLTVTGDNTNSGLPAAQIKNIENIFIRDLTTAGASAYNLALIDGEKQVWSDRSTAAVSFTNVAAGTTIGVKGDGSTTNGATTFKMSSGTDAVSVVIDGGVKAGNITRDNTGAATVTISSTGAANTVGTIDVDTAALVTGLTVNATTNLTATLAADYTATSTLTVSGTATNVTLNGGATANFKTIDASGLTAGGVTIALGTGATTYKGGTGADKVTTAAITVAASAIDAAAGTDTLVINATTDVDTSAEAKQYANFEVLDVAANTADVALFTNSAIAALRIGGAATVNNVTAVQAAAITQYAAGSATINVKDATVVGNVDTVKITVDDGAAAVNVISIGTPVLAGVEKLDLVATDSVTIAALTSATGLTGVTGTGAGVYNVTTGAVNFANNSVFDFSAATGAVTFNASAAQAGATAGGIAIKGSTTAANTLSDSVKTDSVTGGAKSDTLAFLGGSDTIKLGAAGDVTTFDAAAKGTDVLGTGGVKFTFADGDSISKAGSGSALGIGFDTTTSDTITGFDATALATNAGAKFTLDTAQAATAVAVGTTAVTLGTTTTTNAFDFVVVNDTAASAAYVYQDTNGNKVIDSGEFAIKLVGSAALAAGEFSVSSGDLVFTAA